MAERQCQALSPGFVPGCHRQRIGEEAQDFAELLRLLEGCGYEVKPGKHLSFYRQRQGQNIRLRSLGPGYSEAELRAVIQGKQPHNPRKKKSFVSRPPKQNLIAEIEAKIGTGKGAAYDQKLKVVKLKAMAETLLFIQRQDFPAYDSLLWRNWLTMPLPEARL